MVRRVLKTDVKNINEDLITFVGDRPGHDMRYAIDPFLSIPNISIMNRIRFLL